MSLDRSLKSASSLVRHRNVLTRAERLDRLADEEKWDDSKSVFNLPKVGNRKMALAKAEKAEVAADGTTPAAGRAAPCCWAPLPRLPARERAAAPAAKGAAPAAGAKAAAPAAGAKKK